MKLDVSTDKGYTLASAIRGPDLPRCSTLKFVFTARIRELCGVPATWSGWEIPVVRSAKPGPLDDADCSNLASEIEHARAADDTRTAILHWLVHTLEALQELNKPPSAEITYLIELVWILRAAVVFLARRTEDEIFKALVAEPYPEGE